MSRSTIAAASDHCRRVDVLRGAIPLLPSPLKGEETAARLFAVIQVKHRANEFPFCMNSGTYQRRSK